MKAVEVVKVGEVFTTIEKEAASPPQMGQVRLDFSMDICEYITFSHLSTHFEWNSWLQGRIRSDCRTSKSHMQTTQVV